MKITIDFGGGEPITLDIFKATSHLIQILDRLSQTAARDRKISGPDPLEETFVAPRTAAEPQNGTSEPPKKPDPVEKQALEIKQETPPAPVEEPADPIVSEITEEEVKQVILQYTTDNSAKEAVGILQRVAGVGKVNRIPADKLEAVYAEFSRLTEKSLGV